MFRVTTAAVLSLEDEVGPRHKQHSTGGLCSHKESQEIYPTGHYFSYKGIWVLSPAKALSTKTQRNWTGSAPLP